VYVLVLYNAGLYYNIFSDFDLYSIFFRFWIDTADKQPCVGTSGMIPWKLHVTGKLFHSGLCDKVCSYNIFWNFLCIRRVKKKRGVKRETFLKTNQVVMI
jgi:hypothetical protein